MKITGLAFVAACLITCATRDQGPEMPSFATEAGKACGHTCQATSSKCRLGCGQMTRGATTTRQRAKCVDECNATLVDCYSTCE